MADEDPKDGKVNDPGAGPGNKDGQNAGAGPAPGQDGGSPPPKEDEVLKDEHGTPLPWDQQPKWKQARAAEAKLNDLLSKNECESVEDLLELVSAGRVVLTKGIDLDDIDNVIADSAEIRGYRPKWEEQRRLKLRENETPEERADRVEKENEDLRKRLRQDETTRKETAQAERAIKAYEGEVRAALEDLPKEIRPLVEEFCGVGNAFNTVDINDKRAVRKMVADNKKKVNAIIEKIEVNAIQAYIDGKRKIPDMAPAGGAPKVLPAKDDNKNYKLKDAHQTMKERLTSLLTGGQK